MLNHNHVHTQLRRSPRFSSSSSQANAPNACVAASPSAASSPSGLTKDQSLMLNCRAYGVEIFLNVEDMNSAQSPVNATLKREFLRNVENKSLHENDNEELVPLKTYDTKFSGGKHLRRSPRFVSTPSPTGEGFRKRKVNSGEMKSADLSSSVIENSVSLRDTDLSMWDAKRLRRLRLSSSNTMQHQERFRTSLAEMRSPEVENSVTFQVTDLKVWDSRCLRRSPRLSSYDSAQPQGQFPTSSAETKSPELEDSVSLRATDQKMWDDKRLRTSPRLSSANSTQPRGRFLTSSIEMKSPELENYVSLRVTDVKVLDGQCLRRSSPDSVQPQGRFPTISVETKSLELENFVTLQATDLKMLDGKCLRRSPRLLSSNSIQPQTRFPSSSAEMKSPEIENSVFLRAIDLKMWDDNFVQPQLRFLTSSVEMKPSGIENSLPLRAFDMMGDDTCLRTSLRLSMLNSVQPHKIYLTSSQSSESVDDTNFVSFKTSDVTVTGEKCLRRSPSLAGAGSCNPTYACSKSSDSFEKQPWKKIMLPNSENKRKQYKRTSFFIGDLVPDREAQERWRWRYDLKNKRFKGQVSILNADDKEEIVTNVECHYAQATLDGTIFNLGDCAHIKVRWKGYGPSEDTWESIEGLSNCQERIYDFVRNGLKYKILPRPGDVDVICGGPPCQGISGYNRFRNVDSPLSDERNHQIVIFMDIVKFLKPKYVLMENVVDLLKLDKASLGRYAISRLVHMKYQARLGIIAAGCYGLPQFRLRVFLWGAHPGESLPQFPLPTHDVIAKYWPPSEFECNTVAYDEGQPRELEKAVLLHDAISDLPAV